MGGGISRTKERDMAEKSSLQDLIRRSYNLYDNLFAVRIVESPVPDETLKEYVLSLGWGEDTANRFLEARTILREHPSTWRAISKGQKRQAEAMFVFAPDDRFPVDGLFVQTKTVLVDEYDTVDLPLALRVFKKEQVTSFDGKGDRRPIETGERDAVSLFKSSDGREASIVFDFDGESWNAYALGEPIPAQLGENGVVVKQFPILCQPAGEPPSLFNLTEVLKEYPQAEHWTFDRIRLLGRLDAGKYAIIKSVGMLMFERVVIVEEDDQNDPLAQAVVASVGYVTKPGWRAEASMNHPFAPSITRKKETVFGGGKRRASIEEAVQTLSETFMRLCKRKESLDLNEAFGFSFFNDPPEELLFIFMEE